MASFASQISFLLLFILFATTFNKGMVSSNRMIRCNKNDQRLLLIFKQGVVDPYNKLSSWTIDEEDCCSWEGVYCNNITGRVTELSLFNLALEGEINLSVLQLEYLKHLDLSNNHLETVGMPPSQISKSSIDVHQFHNLSLATLFNQSSSFSAVLHSLNFSTNYQLVINELHWLSQLTSLNYLDLSGSDIRDETKLLQKIAMFPSLSELRLSDCLLRDFPSLDYVNFTSLEVLDLSGNFYMMKLKFPDSFFNITNHIYHLDLEGCGFYGKLPKALLNLQNLKYLDLNSNNLEGSVPDWLGQYERLQYLDIGYNLFHGVIPPSLGNISSLFHLELSHNQLSGNLLATLGQPQNLNHLGIGSNFLVGVLTEKNFSQFSNLRSLDLSSTNFEFDIDPNWVPPFQLEYLDLGNTSIGLNVLTWLYTQRSLKHLDISRLRISIIDVDVFWSFVVGIDDYIDLSHNLIISGDISNVTFCKRYVNLEYNNFTGGLPHISANVSWFFASHNSFSGSISLLLCHPQGNGENMLHQLDLSHNHLSGMLPDCWANWKQLHSLELQSNKLTGKVPPSLASLKNFEILDLRDNNFFGEFSLDLSNWMHLQYLLLDGNEFSGSFPNIPSVAQGLLVIKLRSNQFIGNIPSQLCNLSSLTILDLAENKLSGSIPHCLCNITPPTSVLVYDEMMKIFTKGTELDYNFDSLILFGGSIIDLSANSFSGEIPKELFSVSKMHFLNLSRNHLTGEIPKEIGGMKNLESLDLSYNKLSGEIPSVISNLSFLDSLNLSYNNFIGQIPLGTQIQSFDSWSFVGNPKLCGDPLPKKCNKKEEIVDSKVGEEYEDDDFLKSLYLGMGVGFAVGFWGVCGSLFLVRAWRHKFFRWFNHLVDQLYIFLALCFKSFR